MPDESSEQKYRQTEHPDLGISAYGANRKEGLWGSVRSKCVIDSVFRKKGFITKPKGTFGDMSNLIDKTRWQT